MLKGKCSLKLGVQVYKALEGLGAVFIGADKPWRLGLAGQAAGFGCHVWASSSGSFLC